VTGQVSAHALIEEEQFLSAYRVLAPEHLNALRELTNLKIRMPTEAGDGWSTWYRDKG
jgi:hypothetical protein